MSREAERLCPRAGVNPACCCFQMEVIVGDFGMVVVPRDGADTERIMNQSSILRKFKVRCKGQLSHLAAPSLTLTRLRGYRTTSLW